MSPAEPTAAARVRAAAPLFAALGDETRLQLIMRLSASGPASLAQLGERAKVTRQAITKHVDVLCKAGLVRTHREGRERICELEPQRLADAHAYLEEISRHWDDALARLQHFVER